MSDANPPRRRANVSADDKSKVNPLVKYRTPIIIVLAWAAVMAFQYGQATGAIEAGEECPGHWHAGYAVFIDDQRLSFNPGLDAAWGDANTSPASGFHIHGDDGILHAHPGAERCIPLGEMMEKLDVDVFQDRVEVGAPHRITGTFETNDTHEFVVYHRPWGDDAWTRVANVPNLLDEQPADGDQILFTYVEKGDDATVTQQQEATPSLRGGNYEPPAPESESGIPDENLVPMIAVTVIAFAAILVWRAFAKNSA